MNGRTHKIPPTMRNSKKPTLHMSIDNCLLIGNGLNRCIADGSISWGELLGDIASELGVDYYNSNPMPLEFERIINTYLKKRPPQERNFELYSKIKYKIVELMKHATLPDDAVHHMITEMQNTHLSAILTTNYDYMLEYAFNKKYCFEMNIDEHMYIEKSTYQVDGIEFYHIHGIMGDPRSICLGYNQYMTITSHLRRAISAKMDNRGQSLRIRRVLSGGLQPTGIWAERFFYSNIAMVGFGLDRCESDIWWLLSYRAYLYYTNSWEMRDLIKNNIVYYRIIDRRTKVNKRLCCGILGEECKQNKEKCCFEKIKVKSNWYTDESILTDEERRFNELLRSEHVGVNTYIIQDGQTYEDGYRKILKEIDNKGIREYNPDDRYVCFV